MHYMATADTDIGINEADKPRQYIDKTWTI